VRVHLAYGTAGLDAEVPDDATVVEPTLLDGLDDEAGAVRDALRHPLSGAPLASLVGTGDSVVVIFPDLTRPMPNRTVLPPILDELAALGAGPERVELLCATGTHRAARPAEMADLVGPDIVHRYRIHDHRADDGAHVAVGRVDGTPVLLDRRYVASSVRITTGFVEPHFFAGYSGGPKGVCPGLAATETILAAHSPARIADPAATWTVTDGNPVHDFIRAAVAIDPPTLSVDVAINARRQLTAVFCGPLPGAHREACAFVGNSAVRPVPRRFDVVLTSNGGHPLDRNLYQAVKGMAAAARVVADGGTIVVAAPCGDGVPSPSPFATLLATADGPADLASADGPAAPDRWQTQVLGRVLQRARVQLYADGLSDDEVRRAHLAPVGDVTAAVRDALRAAGPGASLCVLPQGPLTVASAP
jgi:nickel-dependent lactate racemase